jgi:hypothetical protein
MALVLDGNGTIAGISAGGLPSGSITADTLATSLNLVSKSVTVSGITFPGTQIASADANTLDDYEEGTWTPVLSTAYGFTEGASPSYTGKYIKIGKQVTVFFTLDFDASDVPAADDRWRISGLPFLNADTWVGGGTFIQAGSWASDTNIQGVCTAETDEVFGHNVKINGTPPTYATTPVTGAVTYQTS